MHALLQTRPIVATLIKVILIITTIFLQCFYFALLKIPVAMQKCWAKSQIKTNLLKNSEIVGVRPKCLSLPKKIFALKQMQLKHDYPKRLEIRPQTPITNRLLF